MHIFVYFYFTNHNTGWEGEVVGVLPFPQVRSLRNMHQAREQDDGEENIEVLHCNCSPLELHARILPLLGIVVGVGNEGVDYGVCEKQLE